MSITITDGITVITLPYELVWIDEYTWNQTIQNKRFTVGGIMILESSTYQDQAGRPITLYDEDAWIVKSDLDTLASWADQNKQMVLELHDGSTFNIGWRYQDPPVIEAEPVIKKAEQDDTDEYIVSLKFHINPATTPQTVTTTTSTTSSTSTTTTTTP